MAHKKNFNNYRIEGNTVFILITKRNGEKFETLIDLDDLPRMIKSKYSWHVRYDKCTEQYYARATEYCGIENNKPIYKTVLLHRFIMECYDKKYVIDHINHNNLDNRKENLRISLHKQNSEHRKSKNKNNTTGYRNVTFNKTNNKYIVQLQIEGKNTILGLFDDVDEAGKFAEQMRIKYYGDFKGEAV